MAEDPLSALGFDEAIVAAVVDAFDGEVTKPSVDLDKLLAWYRGQDFERRLEDLEQDIETAKLAGKPTVLLRARVQAIARRLVQQAVVERLHDVKEMSKQGNITLALPDLDLTLHSRWRPR